MKGDESSLKFSVTFIEKHDGLTSKKYWVKDSQLYKEHQPGVSKGTAKIVSISLSELKDFMQECNDNHIYNKAFTLSVPIGKAEGEEIKVRSKALSRRAAGSVSLTKECFPDYPTGSAIMGLDYDPLQDGAEADMLYVGFPPEMYVQELARLLPELDFTVMVKFYWKFFKLAKIILIDCL